MRVLVVEDEVKMASLLRRGLEREGYAVDVAENGVDAIWLATENDYDAIVLDVRIPPPDGFEVCRTLRARERWAPVLLLTARDAVEDRVAGLDAGADDYLAKPFAYEELLARVRALLRRREPGEREILRCADLVMDVARHEVRRADRAVELTALQFDVLEHFLRHQDQVLERDRLLASVWGIASDAVSNVVDVTVAGLRARIETDGKPRLLHTIRGVGYVLRET
jgi:two-component system OmpR family response regulator